MLPFTLMVWGTKVPEMAWSDTSGESSDSWNLGILVSASLGAVSESLFSSSPILPSRRNKAPSFKMMTQGVLLIAVVTGPLVPAFLHPFWWKFLGRWNVSVGLCLVSLYYSLENLRTSKSPGPKFFSSCSRARLVVEIKEEILNIWTPSWIYPLVLQWKSLPWIPHSNPLSC